VYNDSAGMWHGMDNWRFEAKFHDRRHTIFLQVGCMYSDCNYMRYCLSYFGKHCCLYRKVTQVFDYKTKVFCFNSNTQKEVLWKYVTTKTISMLYYHFVFMLSVWDFIIFCCKYYCKMQFLKAYYCTRPLCWLCNTVHGSTAVQVYKLPVVNGMIYLSKFCSSMDVGLDS